MSPNKEKLFFAGSVLAQFAVLVGMIFFYQSIVLGGTEIILKTQPVDPRDILRGQYVALRYEISTLDSKLFYSGAQSLKLGSIVYVELEKGGGNIWQAVRASLDKPENGLFIKGTVESTSGSRVNIKYGIESYFVDPERAVELESEARRGILLMRVIVDGDGNGIVRGVFEENSASSLGLVDARARSRDARRVADLAQYRLALELYFDANGSYPENLQDIGSQIMPSLPKDPITGASYHYYLCGPNSYHLGADLEDQTNVSLRSDKDIAALCPGDKVSGLDAASCDGATKDKSCYDVAEGELTAVPVANLPPKVTVTLPNTAQIFSMNQRLNIKWSAQGVPKNGKFQVVVLDEVTKKTVISADLESSRRNYDALLILGAFAPNKFYRAKISLKDSSGNVIISDESDKAFGVVQ